MSRLEQLKKLVAVAPEDPLSHYALGLEYINLQQFGEAAEAFDAALRADAKYSAAYYHKGRALIAGGRTDEARQTLTAGMDVAQAQGDWKTQNEMRELLESIE
jgi:tetratricopeptide (TPR) repeat protein